MLLTKDFKADFDLWRSSCRDEEDEEEEEEVVKEEEEEEEEEEEKEVVDIATGNQE